MAVIMLVHALYLLPLQKDLWEDGTERQNVCMIVFFALFLGAVIPSFDKVFVKK